MTQPIEEQVADLVAASNQLTSAVENKVNEIDLQVSDALKAIKAGRKNHIVDGRFDFWFEGNSQANSGYGSDTMWGNFHTGSTKTHTRKTLLVGDIPATPTARYYSRTVVNSIAGSGNHVAKAHKIEGVRRLAGKRCVLSFDARVDSAKNISIELVQNFGSGGSTSNPVVGLGVTKFPVNTSFTRYEIIIDIPDLAGKTLGLDENDALEIYFWLDAGTAFDVRTDSLGHQSGTFDIACVQLEEGSVATKFEEEGQQASLTRVNRYYWESTPSTEYVLIPRLESGNALAGWVSFLTIMRSPPTATKNEYNCTGTGLYSSVEGIRVFSNMNSGSITAWLQGITADARL